MSPLVEAGLWPAQIKAIKNLEKSFASNKPRALIQMATGSGRPMPPSASSTGSSSSPALAAAVD